MVMNADAKRRDDQIDSIWAQARPHGCSYNQYWCRSLYGAYYQMPLNYLNNIGPMTFPQIDSDDSDEEGVKKQRHILSIKKLILSNKKQQYILSNNFHQTKNPTHILSNKKTKTHVLTQKNPPMFDLIFHFSLFINKKTKNIKQKN